MDNGINNSAGGIKISRHEFPSVRIPKGAKIVSAKFIFADKEIDIKERLQAIIDREGWITHGGTLRIVIDSGGNQK